MHSCRGPAGSGVCLLVVILLLPMWSLPRHISLLAPNLRDAGRVAFKSSEERREEEREGTSGIGEGEGGAVPNRVRKRAETWELGRKGGKEGKGERRKGKEEVKELQSVHNLMVCISYPKYSTKELLHLRNTFSKVTRYKINSKKLSSSFSGQGSVCATFPVCLVHAVQRTAVH